MKKTIKLLAFQFQRPSKRLYWALAAILVILGAGWLFYTKSLTDTLPKSGTLAEDQQFPLNPQAAYRNLDLKIASQAKFDSDSITKIRDLGIDNGVKKAVISFRVADDKLTEYGLMTTPAAAQPPGGYPVIILCHGYATPKVYSTQYYYLSDMEEYSKAGFVVIKPDFRGQGLSLHAGKPEGAYYSMAYNTDVMSLISAVKKTANLDSSNVNLWGHSMGAYIALRAAVISPDIKNVVLLSGPVGKVVDMFRDYTAVSDKYNQVANNIKQAVLLRYGTPVSNPKFWQATSPLSYLGQLKADVQIHVGSADMLVPPRFSQELNAALAAAHKRHSYFVYHGGTHGLVNQRPQIYLRSLQLLLGSTSG